MMEAKDIAPFIRLFRSQDKFLFNEQQLQVRSTKGKKRRLPRAFKKFIKLANSKLHSFGTFYKWNKDKNQIELIQLITGFSDYHAAIQKLKDKTNA